MFKFKKKMLSFLLIALLVPCAVLLTACGGTTNKIEGDWKLHSIVMVDLDGNDEDQVVNAGEELEGEMVAENWVTFTFTKTEVTAILEMSDGDQPIVFAYEKKGESYETEVKSHDGESARGKFVFTFVGDKLKAEMLGEDTDGQLTPSNMYFMLTKGKPAQDS